MLMNPHLTGITIPKCPLLENSAHSPDDFYELTLMLPMWQPINVIGFSILAGMSKLGPRGRV